MENDDNYKKWSEMLGKYGWKIVRESDIKRKNVSIILLSVFLLAVIVLGVFFLVLVQNGKLNSDIVVAPNLPINATFTDADQTDNVYELKTYNNFTVPIYIDFKNMNCVLGGNVTS